MSVTLPTGPPTTSLIIPAAGPVTDLAFTGGETVDLVDTDGDISSTGDFIVATSVPGQGARGLFLGNGDSGWSTDNVDHLVVRFFPSLPGYGSAAVVTAGTGGWITVENSAPGSSLPGFSVNAPGTAGSLPLPEAPIEIRADVHRDSECRIQVIGATSSTEWTYDRKGVDAMLAEVLMDLSCSDGQGPVALGVIDFWVDPPMSEASAMATLRQRQTVTGNTGGPPLRQRQNGGNTGGPPLRQRQTGI